MRKVRVTLKMRPVEMTRLLSAALEVMPAYESNRERLEFIRFEPRGKLVDVVATNGHSLAVIHAPPGTIKATGAVSVPAAVARGMVAAIRLDPSGADCSLVFEVNGVGMRSVFDSQYGQHLRTDDSKDQGFVNWKKVLPKRSNRDGGAVTTCVQPQVLGPAIAIANHLTLTRLRVGIARTKGTDNIAAKTVDCEPLMVTSEQREGWAFMFVAMPVDTSGLTWSELLP